MINMTFKKESSFIRALSKSVIKILADGSQDNKILIEDKISDLGIKNIALIQKGKYENRFIPEILFYNFKCRSYGTQNIEYFLQNLKSYYFVLSDPFNLTGSSFYQIYIHDVSRFHKNRYTIQWYKSKEEDPMSTYADPDEICHFHDIRHTDSVNELMINENLFTAEDGFIRYINRLAVSCIDPLANKIKSYNGIVTVEE